ncbi:Sigma-70 family RNA polymerase sigma factor, partial [Dysosmobacter welbionis]
ECPDVAQVILDGTGAALLGTQVRSKGCESFTGNRKFRHLQTSSTKDPPYFTLQTAVYVPGIFSRALRKKPKKREHLRDVPAFSMSQYLFFCRRCLPPSAVLRLCFDQPVPGFLQLPPSRRDLQLVVDPAQELSQVAVLRSVDPGSRHVAGDAKFLAEMQLLAQCTALFGRDIALFVDHNTCHKLPA